ncbi:MAG: lipopolysaccharide biosynthesis protein [Deltaproteobacteria bacterium]|nr:lipopolysaccharide biosynthesis protein [Deltaproteobacteria bacterium]
MLRTRWRLWVAVPALVGVLSFGLSFLVPKTFTASTLVMPPAQQSSSAISMLAGQLGVLGGLAGGAAGLKNPVDQYVSFLKSRKVTDAIIERFELRKVYDEELTDEARKELLDNISITVGKKDSLITVQVDDHDPKRAADMANAFVDELRRLMTEVAVGEASQRRVFFEGQMKSARTELSAAEERLNAAKISESALAVSPQAAVAGLARLKAMVTAQEVAIASMRGFATDDNPDLRQARAELAALKAQLTGAEGSASGEKSSEYMKAFRDFKYGETLFELMAKQYELARVDEAREGAIIQVIDAAVAPELKSKPRRIVIAGLAAVLAGLAVVVGLIVHHRYADLLRLLARR